MSTGVRLAIQLLVVERVTAVDIARVLDWPNAKAVYNRVYRALESVRKSLERSGIQRDAPLRGAGEDRATATLMEQFYRLYSGGVGAGTALATAQRALLKTRATSHPFYWAGFSGHRRAVTRGKAARSPSYS